MLEHLDIMQLIHFCIQVPTVVGLFKRLVLLRAYGMCYIPKRHNLPQHTIKSTNKWDK